LKKPIWEPIFTLATAPYAAGGYAMTVSVEGKRNLTRFALIAESNEEKAPDCPGTDIQTSIPAQAFLLPLRAGI
jgi:hypothetical protein